MNLPDDCYTIPSERGDYLVFIQPGHAFRVTGRIFRPHEWSPPHGVLGLSYVAGGGELLFANSPQGIARKAHRFVRRENRSGDKSLQLKAQIQEVVRKQRSEADA